MRGSPAAENDTDSGDTLGEPGHPDACVTITLVPPTVTVPVRCAPLVFSVNSIVTGPLPATGDGVAVIQAWSSLTP